LIVERVLNFVFSKLVRDPVGFVEPIWCKNIRCSVITIRVIMGVRKCREKNRVRVGFLTEGPPQIQVTRVLPSIGMEERVPVITVAPQKDICPQGRTYPRNAVIISSIIRVRPLAQTFFCFWGEAKYSPRAMCRYVRMNRKEAPFM
jgi:hypothetical protein